MSCPRCGTGAMLYRPDCDVCGFSFAFSEKLLGAHQVVLRPFIDTSHALTLRDSHRVEAMLDEFERRFPQSFCSVFVGLLPGGVSISEAGFWLLNHAVRNCQGEVRDNRFGIALIIDPSTHQSGLSMGYALETFVTPTRATGLLTNAASALWHGDYCGAIKTVVGGIDAIIRRHGEARHRAPPEAGVRPKTLFGFVRQNGGLHVAEAER